MPQMPAEIKSRTAHRDVLHPKMTSAWVYLLVISWPHYAPAAQPPVYSDPEYLISSWDTDDGLPESSVTGMTQTEDGYLWFGTFGGLVRFNGWDFRVYNKANTPSFPGGGVVNLYLDGKSRLWASTLEGLGVLEKGVWRTLGTGEGWEKEFVRTFARRSNGDLLLTGFDGSIREFSQGRFHALPVPGKRGQGSFGAADAEGRWWSVQSGFIGLWDGKSWSPTVEESSLAEEVAAVSARDGGVLVLKGDLLLKFHNGMETSRLRLPEAPGGYWSLMEDSQNRVWIPTSGSGLLRISPDGSFRKWTRENGLASNTLRVTFEDREGNVWIGTDGAGLQRFTERRFEVFSSPENHDRPNFSSIAPRQPEGVWLGSYGQGVFHGSADDPGTLSGASPAGTPAFIQSLLEDSLGRVWVGDYGGGVRFFKEGALRRIPSLDKAGMNGLVLFEDSRRRVWVSGGLGIGVVEGETCRILGPEDGLPAGAAVCFAEAPDGAVWIAHEKGVFVNLGGKFEAVHDSRGDSLRGISFLCADPGGKAVWVGTQNRGLLRWRDGSLASVGYTNGLPSAGIHGLIDDRLGFLWMSNRLGVARAGWKDLNAVADGLQSRVPCVVMTAADGLPGTESPHGRQPLMARDTAGNLWFPFLRAAAMINPARFTLHSAPPPVHLEKVRYLEPVTLEAVPREVELLSPFPPLISLPAGTRRLEFLFAGLDFGAPDKIRYEVKLEGRDLEWRDAGGTRAMAVYELPPGRYTFRVRAANRDGVWNEEGAAQVFEIGAFYWQRTWFRAAGAGLLICVGGVAVGGFTRSRHRRMRERLAHQEQRAELAHLSRVATLSELSGSLAHELNQPLAIILSNAQAAQRMLGREPLDIGEIKDILADIVSENRRAGDVIHRLRAMMKRGETRRVPEDVNQLVTDGLSLTKQELLNRGVEVECDFSPGSLTVLADRIQLQQVVINLITNACDAMAHIPSSERRLRLVTAERRGHVRLSVMDRGCGLPHGDPETTFKPFFTTKPQGLGLGLCICRSIVQAHGGTLKAERNSPCGAVFVLSLPHAADDES